MSQGSKAAYSSKDKRQASHIEEGYEKRGVSKKESEKRAWATVNKERAVSGKTGSSSKEKKR